MVLDLILYICSFIAIWIGAGLIIRSIDSLSSRLRLSSFAISFFILGLLTSIPEFSVGITSIVDKDPEIFVGTLLGGVIVIFLFVIPLLAVLGNGIRLNRQLDKRNLLLSILVIASPPLFLIDNRITNIDGTFMILLYIVLLIFMQKKKGLFDAIDQTLHKPKIDYFKTLLTIFIGVLIVFLSSNFVVEQTLIFSEIINVSPFYISLLGLSIGTNLPELSLAVRSVLSGKKDIALGDYIGSAATNTLLFGVLTILNPTDVYINGNFITTFFFIIISVFCFYLFSRSRNDISRSEGLILLTIYCLFLFLEFSTITVIN